MWIQKEISLPAKPRGFHLITNDILNSIPVTKTIKNGLLHVFIKHTSASLTINENADPSVRQILNLISIIWYQKINFTIYTLWKDPMICLHI